MYSRVVKFVLNISELSSVCSIVSKEVEEFFLVSEGEDAGGEASNEHWSDHSIFGNWEFSGALGEAEGNGVATNETPVNRWVTTSSKEESIEENAQEARISTLIDSLGSNQFVILVNHFDFIYILKD